MYKHISPSRSRQMGKDKRWDGSVNRVSEKDPQCRKIATSSLWGFETHVGTFFCCYDVAVYHVKQSMAVVSLLAHVFKRITTTFC